MNIIMNKRERFALWEESCLEIERKAIYRNYPMIDDTRNNIL